MTSVFKMNRAQLVAEIESYGFEAHGNVHDLRDTLKLARSSQNPEKIAILAKKSNETLMAILSLKNQ